MNWNNNNLLDSNHILDHLELYKFIITTQLEQLNSKINAKKN